MKRPSPKTMILGHPIVAVPIVLASAIGLYACLLGGSNGLFPALIFGATALTTSRASSEARAYRAWKAEWEAMSGTPQPRSSALTRLFGIALGFLLVFGGLAALQSAPFATGYALGFIVLLGMAMLGLLTIRTLVRWIRPGPGHHRDSGLVKVIAKPALPLPPRDAGRKALPDYCQQVLRR